MDQGPYLERLEKICKPRLPIVTETVGKVLIGIVILALGAVMILPIPFLGNMPPGFAASVIAIGMTERDGLIVLIGTYLFSRGFNGDPRGTFDLGAPGQARLRTFLQGMGTSGINPKGLQRLGFPPDLLGRDAAPFAPVDCFGAPGCLMEPQLLYFRFRKLLEAQEQRLRQLGSLGRSAQAFDALEVVHLGVEQARYAAEAS